MKLYCVKDHEVCFKFVKGKVYEADSRYRVIDENGERMGCEFDSFADFKAGNPGYGSALVPLISRPAKVGELVYVDRAKYTGDTYENGDVCRVEECLSSPSGIYAISPSGKTHPCCNYDGHPGKVFICDEEYLVLDGYERKEQMKFTKDDLKDGQPIRLRDGRLDFVDGARACNGTQRTFSGKSLNRDLTCSTRSDWDIVEVYELKSVWQREEKREITAEEAARIIKEKCGEEVSIKL